jgi:hypothetical protein
MILVFLGVTAESRAPESTNGTAGFGRAPAACGTTTTEKDDPVLSRLLVSNIQDSDTLQRCCLVRVPISHRPLWDHHLRISQRIITNRSRSCPPQTLSLLRSELPDQEKDLPSDTPAAHQDVAESLKGFQTGATHKSRVSSIAATSCNHNAFPMFTSSRWGRIANLRRCLFS